MHQGSNQPSTKLNSAKTIRKKDAAPTAGNADLLMDKRSSIATLFHTPMINSELKNAEASGRMGSVHTG